MRTLPTWSTALLLVAVGAGCSTHTAVTTAHTVGKGKFQGAVEPGMAILPGATTVNADGDVVTRTFVGPTLNGAFRYGLSEKFELGARLGTVSYEITGKYMFLGPDGVVVSLAPSTTIWALSVGGYGGGFFTLGTPLLIGLPVGEHQVILGPNWILYSAFGGGGGTSVGGFSMGPGLHAAFSAKLGDNFRLHPELSLKMPALIGFASASTTATGTGTATASGGGTGSAQPIMGFTLGLLFGGN